MGALCDLSQQSSIQVALPWPEENSPPARLLEYRCTDGDTCYRGSGESRYALASNFGDGMVDPMGNVTLAWVAAFET